jgi:nicotinamide-nucleotide amidase
MIKAKVIAIGDEILIGQILDTNSNYIANKLKNLGISLNRIVVCPDTYGDIMFELESALNNHELVFITGGLGPTKDDITKNCLCDFFETKLVENEIALKNVERIILPRYGVMNPQNREQALVPEKANVYNNRLGTAPILRLEKQGTSYYSMPGVPFEMKEAFEKDIIPELKEKYSISDIVVRNIMVTGIGESFLAQKLEEWESSLIENLKLAYLPSPERIRLRLTASGVKTELENYIDTKILELKTIIPNYIYATEEKFLPEVIGDILTDNGQTISSAESCTGGNIAHQFTKFAGSSAYFKGSVVAYSNEIKERVLNVSPKYLEEFGAVSKQVVEQMAVGVRELTNTDFAVSTSGIAGPTGGSPEKPVGTIWIAVASKDRVVSKKLQLSDHRERNIIRSTIAVINLLRLEFLSID